jgi:hypothetical protein
VSKHAALSAESQYLPSWLVSAGCCRLRRRREPYPEGRTTPSKDIHSLVISVSATSTTHLDKRASSLHNVMSTSSSVKSGTIAGLIARSYAASGVAVYSRITVILLHKADSSVSILSSVSLEPTYPV